MSFARLARMTGPALTLLGVALLPACSMRQVYDAGQAWQQQECSRIADLPERKRCMASLSYDDYQRQAAAAKGVK